MKSSAKSGYLFLEGQNVGLKERVSKLKSASTSTKNTASVYERGASGERSVALHTSSSKKLREGYFDGDFRGKNVNHDFLGLPPSVGSPS